MAKPRRPRQPTLPFDRSVRVRLLSVFYSYSHVDEILCKELEKQLSPLRRKRQIATWYDREIVAGSDFGKEIDHYLETSDIVLLLVSSDFLASNYCYSIEMKRALKRHEDGLAAVIPIILRPCDWQSTPIGRLLALPKDGKPVTAWKLLDEALLDVAQGVRRAVEDILKVRSSRKRVRGALTNPAIRRKA